MKKRTYAKRPLSSPHKEKETNQTDSIPSQSPTTQSETSSPIVQTKLTLGGVSDRYEQEADDIANRVTNDLTLSQPPTTLSQPQNNTPIDAAVESAINQARGGGQPLADEIRQPMEQAFGTDFGDVRIHSDQRADALNQALHARAFTTDKDIFIRQGEDSDKKLVAHELTHVVQQSNSPSASSMIQREYDPVEMDAFLHRSPPRPNEYFDDYIERLQTDLRLPLGRTGYDFQYHDEQALLALIHERFPNLRQRVNVESVAEAETLEIPDPPAGQTPWTLDQSKAKDVQEPTEAAQATYDLWVRYVQAGWHPKIAAEKVSDAKWDALNAAYGQYEFRVSGGLRIAIIVDSATRTVEVKQRYGHS